VDVAEHLSRIPAQPVAALLVLRLIENPDTSPAELGRLVEMDPALSARVMRLANSPHSGVRSGVRSAQRAVLQLGFSTVRAIVASAATGLLAESADLGPDGNWLHSVAVAASASIAAELFGVPSNEAFSAGLLHDTGSLVLHRTNPTLYAEVVQIAMASSEPKALLDAELEAFGTTHPDAGADALDAWQFPRSFVDAVRNHHGAIDAVRPLTQAVILGQAIAHEIEPVELGEVTVRLDRVLAMAGLPAKLQKSLIVRARAELDSIANFLGQTR